LFNNCTSVVLSLTFLQRMWANRLSFFSISIWSMPSIFRASISFFCCQNKAWITELLCKHVKLTNETCIKIIKKYKITGPSNIIHLEKKRGENGWHLCWHSIVLNFFIKFFYIQNVQQSFFSNTCSIKTYLTETCIT